MDCWGSNQLVVVRALRRKLALPICRDPGTEHFIILKQTVRADEERFGRCTIGRPHRGRSFENYWLGANRDNQFHKKPRSPTGQTPGPALQIVISPRTDRQQPFHSPKGGQHIETRERKNQPEAHFGWSKQKACRRRLI